MREEEWKIKFPKQIKSILELKNMSQRQLAKRMKISEVSVSRYLNGERIPKGNILISMAKALNCHVSWLLEFDKFDELQKDKAVKLYELRKRLEDLSINMIKELFESIGYPNYKGDE